MLAEKLSKYNIILASKSPRRQELFKKLYVPFSVQTKEVEEIYPLHFQAEEITNYLADLKSKAFDSLDDKDLLITSDTIVWFQNEAIGKPKDQNEAFNMLTKMSGKKHTVYTSISIKTNYLQKIFWEKTIVDFDELTDKEINFYLEKEKPFDKAGSYGIQDWIGLIGIKKIEGSYFNVVGLPVHKLYKELMSLPK